MVRGVGDFPVAGPDGVTRPFEGYVADMSAGRALITEPDFKGRRFSVIRNTHGRGQYLQVRPERECRCSGEELAECRCLRYWHVTLAGRNVPYGRLLTFLEHGLPCRRAAAFGRWVVHHSDKIRVQWRGRRMWVADDCAARVWELRKDHTGQHNAGRRHGARKSHRSRAPK